MNPAPHTSSETLTAADGGQFGLTRVAASPPLRLPLVFIPGMFTARRFWLSDKGIGLAAYLAQAGFPGYIVERRGMGESPANGVRPGLQEHLRYDLPLVQQLVADEQPQPAVWLGHSFGGILASRAVAACADPAQVAGLILFATQFEVGKRMLDWPANLLTRAMVRILGRLPARSTGLGPEDEPAAAVIDATNWVAGGRRKQQFAQSLAAIQCPVLALSGAGDTVDPAPGCERFISHFGSADKRFVLAGRDTGFPVDFNHPGIVISKPAQTSIWPLVADWLQHRHFP